MNRMAKKLCHQVDRIDEQVDVAVIPAAMSNAQSPLSGAPISILAGSNMTLCKKVTIKPEL